MYPSDYGLSASEANWTTKLYGGSSVDGFEDATVNATTWMYTMMDAKTKYSWFLSPSSDHSYSAAIWRTTGHVNGNGGVAGSSGVRPVLNLSGSLTTTYEGDGTSSENAYRIFAN